MVDGGLIFGFSVFFNEISLIFQWILIEMGVLVHPQLGLRFGAALPFFSSEKTF